MLYLVGIGLGSAQDLTIRGFEILKICKYIYLDSYTSIIPNLENDLRLMCNKDIIVADREMVEQNKIIIDHAKHSDVSFIVVGDPLCATTHTGMLLFFYNYSDLILRAVKEAIPYKIIHNASIITAVGCSGLQLYNFGITVSIPFWEECGRPESFFDRIEQNFLNGFHTLCLLDIKVKEQSLDNLLRCRNIYEEPKFMTFQQAVSQITEIIHKRKETSLKTRLNTSCVVIGLARIGSEDQAVVVSTLGNIISGDHGKYTTALGGPLHSLIIPGKIEIYEIEFLLSRYCSQGNSESHLPIFIVNELPNFLNDMDYFSGLLSHHNELLKSTEE